jgi:ankyrin repeat protein
LKKDRLDLFERKLAELGDVSQQDHNNMTSLLESVAMNKPDFLRAILKEHKAKVNEQKNSKGLTALHLGT